MSWAAKTLYQFLAERAETRGDAEALVTMTACLTYDAFAHTPTSPAGLTRGSIPSQKASREEDGWHRNSGLPEFRQ